MNDVKVLIKWLAVIVASILAFIVVYAGMNFLGIYILQNDDTTVFPYVVRFGSSCIATYTFIIVGIAITELDKKGTLLVLIVIGVIFILYQLIKNLKIADVGYIAQTAGALSGFAIAYLRARKKNIV